MIVKLQTLKPKLQVLDTRRVPTMAAGSRRTEGMTSTQRGYGYKWQKAREAFLRENPLCVVCTAQGVVTVATVVDHITPPPPRGSVAFLATQQLAVAMQHSPLKRQAAGRGTALTLALLLVACGEPVGCMPTGEVGKVERMKGTIRIPVWQWVEAEKHQCSDGLVRWIER